MVNFCGKLIHTMLEVMFADEANLLASQVVVISLQEQDISQRVMAFLDIVAKHKLAHLYIIYIQNGHSRFSFEKVCRVFYKYNGHIQDRFYSECSGQKILLIFSLIVS